MHLLSIVSVIYKIHTEFLNKTIFHEKTLIINLQLYNYHISVL